MLVADSVARIECDADAFHRDGYLCARGFYRADEIARLSCALEHAKRQAQRPPGDADASLIRDVSLSAHSADVAAFARDPRLGAFAARLLGARGIRLIHDVLVEKQHGQGATPWHRDSDFWSFAGIGAVTAWIPLLRTPLSMSPLRYARASHRRQSRRAPWRFAETFIPLRYRVASASLEIGDVAWHHYRTLHGAAPNRNRNARRALAVHLIDADARFRSPSNAGQLEHAVRCGWMHLRDGDPFPDDIAPLVYGE